MKAGIQGIGLLAAGLEGWRAGRAVLAGTESFAPVTVPDPEATLLPSNERRRSSECVRWAVHVAQEAIVQSGLDPREVPTIFASSGGETGTLNAICRALATQDRVISPTLFHQSVHNTAAGYWSIATTCQQSSTALSCYDDSFAAGLLEAMTLVCMEQCPVLLVAYDLAVPAPLNEARPISTGFAVALVLAPLSGSSLTSIDLRLEEAQQEGACSLQHTALEQVRMDNPAARSLLLLSAIAAGNSQTVSLSLLDSQQLILDLDPCHN
jgi:Beta-ketoacyl synthase, N-terminal domain